MDTRRLLSLLLTIIAIFFISSPVLADRPLSSAGIEFVVGYRPELHRRSGDQQIVVVTTQHDNNVDFTVSDGNTAISYTVNSTSELIIDLHLLFGGEDQKGIIISSSDRISELIVMGLISHTDGLVVDTYTVLPSHNYSSYTYFAVSHSASEDEFKGFVQIVGTEASTTVTFTPAREVEQDSCPGSPACVAGEQCTVVLQKLEMLLLCSSLDLTGTKIVSDKPLSVFSGHTCTSVPVNVGNCEFLIEQIPPVLTWGKTFLVGPLRGRATGEIYKVVSAEANTNVSVYCTHEDDIYNPSFELTGEGSVQEFSVGSTRRCSIRADKPLMVMLLAPNEGPSQHVDGAFMSLIPPVKQLTDSVNVLAYEDTSVTITLPESSCPKSQCSILIDDGASINLATSSKPIHCSPGDVCGYSVVTTLSEGVHRLRLSEPAGMAVISYTFTAATGYGTVTGLALNHIAVSSPKLSITTDGEYPLMSGERLVLTCSVSLMGDVGDGIQISARWLRGEGGEEIISRPPIEVRLSTPFKIEHSFESLSMEDSNTYKCEANLTSRHAGLLATAAESMDISVMEPATFGYIQLLIVGVTKCSEWVLMDTEEKADEVTQMVVEIVQQGCNCDFSSHYISSASFKCPSVNPEVSNEVLYRAQIQAGGSSPVSYSEVVEYLEAAQSKSFSLKGFLLTIDSDERCSVMVDSLNEPTTCFSTSREVGNTGGVDTSDDQGDKSVIIIAVVASCAVVFLLGLASLIVGGVVISRHRAHISNQRPKSIHLHHKMMPGGNSRSRLMPSGDSVTSFSPQSGSANSTIYIQKDSNPSSPTTVTSFPLSQNGVTTPSPPISQDVGTDKTSFPLPQNGVSSIEEEENYTTMKTDLSQWQIPISHV